MKIHNLPAFILILTVICFASANAGQAAQISYTTNTPIVSELTDWVDASLSFQQFDSSLGTLTAVKLEIGGSFDTTIQITNDSPESSSGTGQTEVKFSVDDLDGNLTSSLIDLYSAEFSYSLAAGGTITSGTITTSGSSVATYIASAVLSEFTGTGTIELDALTNTKTWLSNTGGNTAIDQDTYASLTGTVTYYYEPVPEPSTVVLFGVFAVNLLGFYWFRR